MSETLPRRGRPANPERIAAIADAIVTLLAESGARGVTHRAVDQLAGLPSGTAGYHAPTHLDLMLLGSRRIGELGLAELGWLTELVDGSATLTPEQVIDPLLATWRERLRPDSRHRARAEIAVALSSGGDPAIRSVYTAPNVFVDIWTRAMTLLGARSPRAAAAEFTGLIRGRFHQHVLSGASLDDDRTLRTALSAALHALIALDPDNTPPAETQNDRNGPDPRRAQDTEPMASGDGLKDIVVTARRQSETLQRAALAVSVMGGEDLVQRGIRPPRTDGARLGASL